MTQTSLWTAADIIRITRGRSLHEQNWQARGVKLDNRAVTPGDIFIALQGPNHDGHDYVAAAFKAGAVAAIVAQQPTNVAAAAALIFVADTFEALQELGRAGRARAAGKMIGITGSVGKTTTKEMLRLCLSAVGNAYANPGSFNNHWGVPLALANLPPDADYGVFELGMNHAGEMAALAAQVRPDIAVITTIEAVHLEFFADVAAIADAKAEIFQGMDKNGIVILNRSNPYYARLCKAAKKQGLKKIYRFAESGRADAALIDCAATSEGCAVNAMLQGDNIHYAIGAPGRHLVMNSLAALLAAAIASGKKDECAAALSRFRQPQGRGVKSVIPLSNGDTFILIDDSYNASPVSVGAAIEVVARMIPQNNGRRILVLGDMLELGETSSALHAGLAADIERAKMDAVYCCGPLMRCLFDALPPRLQAGYAATSALLAPVVAAAISADDIVCIKGSKGMKMGRIIESLTAIPTATSHNT